MGWTVCFENLEKISETEKSILLLILLLLLDDDDLVNAAFRVRIVNVDCVTTGIQLLARLRPMASAYSLLASCCAVLLEEEKEEDIFSFMTCSFICTLFASNPLLF